MFSQKFFGKRQLISVVFTIAASVVTVAGLVYAATTIGTNVSVDGNLTVSGTSATTTFSTGGFTVGANQFVVQQTSGMVGIGTTTPWGLLSVNPTSAIGANPQFVVGSSTATSFIVDKNGYVGIGTAGPTNYVHIFKNQNTTTNIVLDNPNTGSSASTNITLTQDDGDAQYVKLHYLNSGGLGTFFSNQPSGGYIITGAAAINGFAIDVLGSAPIRFATADTERMRIDAVGNIGIGTTTPYSKFHVSQGASATTTVNFGEVGSATSKACFNTKNVSGADISFYFSAANALIIENNLCR